MLQAFSNIVPLFILIGVGYFLVKIKIADISWSKAFNLFSINVGFPCLIFYSLYNSTFDLGLMKEIGLVQFCYLTLSFLIGVALLKKTKLKPSFISAGIFHNIAFLGIPIINSLFSQSLENETSLISACYLFFFFTLGIGYLEKTESQNLNISSLIFRCFKNPLLASVILGVLVQILNINLPNLIEYPVKLIAQAITPIVLISLGVFLATIDVRSLQLKTVFVFSLYSLILAPILCLLVCRTLQVESNTSILEAAMPVAFTPFALAERYSSLNKKFLAESIMVSTILSILTLPFIYDYLTSTIG